MRTKVPVIAVSEFTTLVQSKAFLLGLVLMPVFMLVAMGVQRFTRDVVDTRDKAFVVIDRSGVLFDALKQAADAWNEAGLVSGARRQPRYLPLHEPGDVDLVRLSERVRTNDLYAFIEIPADAVSPDSRSPVSYFSNHPGDRVFPAWVATTLNREIVNLRFREASIDRAVVNRLTRRVELSELGLVSRDANGAAQSAPHVDRIRTVAIPVAMMMILLFSVMSSAPQLLNSVIEEKMSRISEVLIGSVTPYELMMGKLLGSAAVAVLLAVTYVGGGVFLAGHYGYSDAVRASDLGWLFLFLAMAVFIFGSVFITIGAACSDLKDAQGMMPPAMAVLMLPWMTWFSILNAPESGIAIALSMLPTATPFLMLLRIAIPPGPPWWQIVLAVLLTGATALFFVHAAGKIFRTGLLMQGKAASFGEMWRWVRTS
jgi:ABC-2 type transport system permease protein